MNAADYRRVFLVRVHELLALGYARLPHADYSETDEPSITGFLAQAIRQLFDDPPPFIDSWCDKYSIADEAPENTEGKTGKDRRRIDIRLESSERRPRAQFRFEAKRLTDANSLSEYFLQGLHRFLISAYAVDDLDAGMLGYVQNPDEQIWAERLQNRLEEMKAEMRTTDDGAWMHHNQFAGLGFTYRTRHRRQSNDSVITIFHMFLRFY